MKILGLDTSNQTMNVVVGEDETVLGNYQLTGQKNHSKTLMPAINQLVAQCGLTPSGLDRIVVAKGPGSYTGLRIGVTTAKTLAWTLGIELVGVSSLAVLANNVQTEKGYIVPLFNARRQNVYSACYRRQNNELVCVKAERHIALDAWLAELATLSEPIYFVGTDVALFKETIQTQLTQAIIPGNQLLHQIQGQSLLDLGVKEKPVTSLAEFVPDYLKRVEAEEKWLAQNPNAEETNYVEKI